MIFNQLELTNQVLLHSPLKKRKKSELESIKQYNLLPRILSETELFQWAIHKQEGICCIFFGMTIQKIWCLFWKSYCSAVSTVTHFYADEPGTTGYLPVIHREISQWATILLSHWGLETTQAKCQQLSQQLMGHLAQTLHWQVATQFSLFLHCFHFPVHSSCWPNITIHIFSSGGIHN